MQARDVIKLGKWYGEPMEWQVLHVKADKALLLSKYAFACRQYHTSFTNVTWESCYLRQWLNQDFFQLAFNEEEARFILNAKVPAEHNPDFDTNPGNDTYDKIFLLSVQEAQKYFANDEARICYPKDHLKFEGAWLGDNGACAWWLRTPGDNSHYAAGVFHVGCIRYNGFDVNYANLTVRPALWYKLGV